MKSFDSESASACFAEGAVPPDLSVDTDDLGEEMGSEELVQYLKDSAGKMTYTVNETQIEGDTATVNVNITYTDITPVVTQAMADYIAKAFEMAMNEGVELDEAEAQKLFTDTLTETVLIAEKNDLQKYCIFFKNLVILLRKTAGSFQYTKAKQKRDGQGRKS